MIEYPLGDRKHKIDFNKFLSLTIKGEIKYKSDYKDFAQLYEFIDKNIKNISKLLFDGYEYILENGVLHNLYGPAYIRINDNEKSYTAVVGQKILWFYIDGKLVYDKLDKRGCKTEEDFNKKYIFFYEELTNKIYNPSIGPSTRRKEGIDYKKIPINLEERRKIDQRGKKINKLMTL